MNFLDKIKLMWALNKLISEVQKMDKLKALLAKMDGLKSVAGLLGVVAYYALPQFGIQVPDIVLKVSSGLAGVGLAHKLDKATGILSKVIDIVTKVSTVATQTSDKLNEGDKK